MNWGVVWMCFLLMWYNLVVFFGLCGDLISKMVWVVVVLVLVFF